MRSLKDYNREAVESHLERNLKLHADFFWNRSTHLLIFAEHCASASSDPDFHYKIEGQGEALSKEFLVKNAFELGVQSALWANGAAVFHQRTGDNWHPYINVDWGVGVTAGLITGKEDVVFEKSTSYSSGPVVHDWGDLGKLHLDTDNLWIDCVRRFWRGVGSVELFDGIAVMPYVYRSPLDYANDLRGNRIFLDMYDNPDGAEALIEYCAKAILRIDAHLREECPILRNLPGGIWGAGFGKETIFLNGDPVDLISEEMGRRFNNPFVELLTSPDRAVYFHHHSIGHARASLVSATDNLSLQEILQDPNGPFLVDTVGDDMIRASMETPIHLDVNIGQCKDYESILERLSPGRFIISVVPDEPMEPDGEYKKKLDLARSYQKTRSERSPSYSPFTWRGQSTGVFRRVRLGRCRSTSCSIPGSDLFITI